MAASDQDILQRFANRKTRDRAYRDLVEAYSNRIYLHCRRVLRSHEDANDVTQEVFIKVWKNLDGFKQEAALSTWIYRITGNECISFLRKQKRQETTPLEDHHAGSIASGMPHEESMTLQKLDAAVRSLPAKQRQVFVLRYYDEMKYEEMADVLDTSVGALKASYHHAVRKIKEMVTAD
jgi:RNA polymerase sigma factor (sigma-70 family)